MLCNGADYFPALIAAIQSARHEILLETYIYRVDTTGQRIGQALQQAAQRGVDVCLLVDGFGSADLPAAFRTELQQAGVKLMFFRPEISRFALQRHRLRRLHRKLAVIDGRIGFVGGINILNDNDHPDEPPRYDYALQIEGPLLGPLHAAATVMWRRTAWMQLRHDWAAKRPLQPMRAPVGPMPAALLVRDNLKHRHAIETAYLSAIRSARHEIVIANAYFLPGYTFRHALLAAARRGVKVTLLLQGKRDHALLQYACKGFYRRFMNAGIEIHEYTRSFMHAKVAVIDGEWLTVGSSNIDPFSLLLAREANVVANYRPLAQTLRADIFRAIETEARRVKKREVVRARWVYGFLAWMALLIVRALMELVGYGHREYRE